MNLDRIPPVHPDVIFPAFLDLKRNSPPDQDFLKYAVDKNPGLAKIVKMFIGMCRDDHDYKIMISCLIVCLKAINNQLEINDMEN
jgi:hypothetical protein